MAKRHTLHHGDWASVFRRLEELVLANSGEDAFEEIFKLLVVKLYLEMDHAPDQDCAAQGTASETARYFNLILAQAATRWSGIIQGQPISKLTDEHLAICIEILHNLPVLETGLEVFDSFFEYLINKSSKGTKGQFFTPRHVIECCVQIVNPRPFETVLDPACGSGGFLLHAYNHMRKNYPDVPASTYTDDTIWGCDYDQRVLRVAKALFLIAGGHSGNLFRVNSLLKPATMASMFPDIMTNNSLPHLTIEDLTRSRFRNFNGFDTILTNPPFAGEIKEDQILSSYMLSRKNRRVERDVLFLERCIQLLRPGGRLAIILPHNKLGGANWHYIREWLLQHMRIVAVVGLGRNTFLPHTHQKSSVLFGIKRLKPGSNFKDESILFSISEQSGKDAKGNVIMSPYSNPEEPGWIRAEHDLNSVVDSFNQFVESEHISWRS